MKPLLFLLIIFASGCAALNETQQFQAPFNESEFEPYKRTGTATVHGQAFSKTRGGDVKFGAGIEIKLIPRTAYLRELGRVRGEEHKNLFPRKINGDSRVDSYIRTTISDGSGNFEFNAIPAGDYWLECDISWEVPTQLGPESTGGLISKEITVQDGQNVKIMLTH